MNARAGWEHEGSRSEFDEVFCRLLPRLYRRAVAVTGSPEAAEEALHDAYLRLATRPDRMLNHPEPYAYAFATVLNTARDTWRRRRREEPLAEPADLTRSGWDGGIGTREAELETLRLLARLTPRQAGVVLLVDVDGFTLDQAAQALGLHRGTIARTRTRALRKLREQLGPTDRAPEEVHDGSA